ncbi:MAG: hypothetical protein M3414_10095, partial [Pseudomonadota bacterium]|nr:hypothetical protein [Pseudomonadota bacterium]
MMVKTVFRVFRGGDTVVVLVARRMKRPVHLLLLGVAGLLARALADVAAFVQWTHPCGRGNRQFRAYSSGDTERGRPLAT